MILLDTHILLWWVSDRKKLSSKARKSIEETVNTQGYCISAISMWEIALLLKKKKLRVALDQETWLDALEATPGLQIIPIDHRIARMSIFLEEIHKDPADRLIIATARELGIPLVTADKKIQAYPHVTTIW